MNTFLIVLALMFGFALLTASEVPKESPRATCEEAASKTVLYMVENKQLIEVPRIDAVLKEVCK